MNGVHATVGAPQAALDVLGAGGTLETLAASLAVSADAIRSWLECGRGPCEACSAFAAAYWRADADWRNGLVAAIRACSSEPRWAAWLLERTRPEEFAATATRGVASPPRDASTVERAEWVGQMAAMSGDHKTALSALELVARLRGELVERSENVNVTVDKNALAEKLGDLITKFGPPPRAASAEVVPVLEVKNGKAGKADGDAT